MIRSASTKTAVFSLLLPIGLLLGACRSATRENLQIRRQDQMLGALASPPADYGFILRVWDDSVPPLAGLAAAADTQIAAWFQDGKFDSHYDPLTEQPADVMISNTDAARGIVNAFLVAETWGLYAESFADTTYVWVGDRRYCIHYYNISEGESGPPWTTGDGHDLRIGVFRKEPLP